MDSDPPNAPPVLQRSATILVAEDSMTQAFTLKLLLEKEGHRVVTVENGRDALRSISEQRPDLVISDIDMPDLDGYGMCHAIKNNPDTASIPVILLTTLSDPENIVAGLRSRTDYYLTKPYDPSFLIDRVRAALDHRTALTAADGDGGFEIYLGGKPHRVQAEPRQMLNLLLSTYENAIQQYRVLVRTQMELNTRNQQLREQSAKLQASESNFRVLLENMADGMVVVDREGLIRFLNLSASQMLGTAGEAAVQRPFAFPVTPGETREVELPGPSETRLVIELRSFLTIWEGETASLVSLRDISRRRQQEKKILDQQQLLREANEKLHALATEDGLTGVKNHRAFKDALDLQFASSRQTQEALSVILLDVDRFKAFNDSFGHPAGDEVLRQVAKLLVEQVRQLDFVARYGGEEFVVLMPGADRSQAVAAAERIRRAIENAPWKHRSVTASFGAATRSLAMADGAALVAEADQALYASKQGGRNRVTHSLMLQRSRMYS